jgi:hypothetical protein
VTAVDANGNTVPGYLGTVSFASSDSAAVLPASYTFTAADHGVHTFNVTLNTVGAATVTATDLAGGVKGTASTQVTTVVDPSTIDLTHWNLTLPSGPQGSPTVVPTSSLVAGYSSQYFYKNADGALVFWCPVTGVHTTNSSYPRSELRETNADGSLAAWNVATGTATLSATLAVNQIPSTGNVVIGQIHDNGSAGVKDEPLIKLVYQSGNLVAQVRPTPASSTNNNFTLATGIALNTNFSYTIELSNMTLSVQINGVTKYSATIDPSWTSQGMYFKAGAYCQDNVGPATEGAMVTFDALTITHA